MTILVLCTTYIDSFKLHDSRFYGVLLENNFATQCAKLCWRNHDATKTYIPAQYPKYPKYDQMQQVKIRLVSILLDMDQDTWS